MAIAKVIANIEARSGRAENSRKKALPQKKTSVHSASRKSLAKAKAEEIAAPKHYRGLGAMFARLAKDLKSNPLVCPAVARPDSSLATLLKATESEQTPRDLALPDNLAALTKYAAVWAKAPASEDAKQIAVLETPFLAVSNGREKNPGEGKTW